MQRHPAHALVALAVIALASPAERARAETKAAKPAVQPGADGWYDAQPPDASFTVRLPGAFEAFEDESATKQGAVTETSGVKANVAAAFDGTVTYAANCTRQPGDTRTSQQRVADVTAPWERVRPAQYRKPIEQAGIPGVEIQIQDDVKVLRARIVAPGDGRTCTALVHWRPFAKPREADVAKFLDSFRPARR